MKNLVITIITLLFTGWSIAGAQNNPSEYLGLPGDNLNLYAAMKLFQESETLEGFERSLNDENSMINNLDLNNDNLVDYIMVFDYAEGNIHNVVLRVALNQNETQDVAVFTIQKFNDGSVAIQLIGDELLYGKNYIIEPYYTGNGETPNPGYIGNTNVRNNVTVVHTTTRQVASWPVIRFIYMPSYITWRSSWYWGYYPVHWKPWRPFYWHAYYGYHYNWHSHYYAHYRPWNHYRYTNYSTHYYTSIRTYSPLISININKGVYKTTYTRPDLRSEGKVMYSMRTTQKNTEAARNYTAERARVGSTTTVQRAASDNAVRAERRGAGAGTVTRQGATGREHSAVRNSRQVQNPEVKQQATRAVRNTGTTVTTRARTNNADNNKVQSPEVKQQTTRAVRNTGTTVTTRARTNNADNNKVQSPEVKQQTTRAARNTGTTVTSRQTVNRSTPTAVKETKSAVKTPVANTQRRVQSTTAPKANTGAVKAPAASTPQRQAATGTKTSTARRSTPAVTQSAPKAKSATVKSSTARQSAPAAARSSNTSRNSSPAQKSGRR